MKRDTMNTSTNLFNNKPACTHSLIVYVPSTQGLAGSITPEAHQARTEYIGDYMTDLFGGATTTDTSGKYKANNGQKVKEPINQVATACNWSDLQGDKGQAVSQLITEKKTEWGQESIAVEVINNSNMYFV